MRNITITDVRANKGDSAFLIDDGKTAIMYDSGFAFTGYEVADNIKKILGDRKLDFIFLTHSHYDHALGSAYALKYWPDAKTVAGEYATKIFAKPTAKSVMRDLDNKFAKTCGVDSYEDLIDDLKVDIAVADGDEIVAGDMTFVALNLPGHTKCSVGFYCKERKLLLSCESLGIYDGNGDVLPAYLVGYQMALDSIERVKSLDTEAILVPHFGVLEGEKAKRYIERAENSAKKSAEWILSCLKKNISKEEIVRTYIEKVRHGYIKEIFPIDAIKLNTSIMVDLVERELM